MIWGRFNMKKIGINIPKIFVGFFAGLMMLLFLLLILSIYIRGVGIDIYVFIPFVCLSLVAASFISMLLISNSIKLILWVIINTILWCIFLWISGSVIFSCSISFVSMLIVIVSTFVGSVIGMLTRCFIGGKR